MTTILKVQNSKNNYFIGHWQSFNNLENSCEYLSKSLSNHPLLKNSLSSHKKVIQQ